MTDEASHNTSFRNILVAVDTSAHSRAALDAAINLARILKSDVQGLFVRDSEWYHISRLPFISEISELTGEVRPLPEQMMRQHISMIEKRIQQMAQLIEKHSEVTYSWKSVTGSVTERILEASKEADLITLGRMGHSLSSQKKLGRLAQAVVDKSAKPVLLLQEGLTLGDNIVVVYDASEQSQRGLKAAISLAEKIDRELIVLVLGNDPNGHEERDKKVEDLLHRTDIQVSVTFMKPTHIWAFAHVVSRFSSGMLIIPKDQPIIRENSVGKLLELINRPLLLVS